MSKSNIFKQLTAKSLVGILLAGGISTQLDNQALATDNANSSNGIFGLELYYRDSAFSCSNTTADIKVKVYDLNNNLLTTMSKGEKYTTTDFDSANDLVFKYHFSNFTTAHCKRPDRLYSAVESRLLGSQDSVPTLGTYAGQASISSMLAGLDSYKELYLVELWSTSGTPYDLQDIVLVVDNNPAFPD
jgi:hypothetical protein